ncbi:MAG: hypothetical protein KAV18_04145, partial [Candidatus Omnitrophica bacterium]|nr:hypothetical protein [Candidatus Omnitrophota bacterium]
MFLINEKIRRIAEVEFPDIVENTANIQYTFRIFFTDRSYLDIWFSWRRAGCYSYHWERRHIDGKIYRHDNIPHGKWKKVATFPKHFHDGSESPEDVKDSLISDNAEEAL